MSFGLISNPVKFAPAYKPVIWSFSSSFSPNNTNAGEFAIPISEIRIATQADVDNYGVNITDVLMFYANTPDLLHPYQQFTVYATAQGLYNGIYRVRTSVNDGLAVIDAEYQGDDTGGKLDKVYERYTLIAEVTFSGLNNLDGTPAPVKYAMKPDANGVFSIDIQDAAQRGFKDILSHVDCRPNTPYTTIAEGENYITQTYQVKIYHGYILTSATGEFQFVEILKGVETKFPAHIVVNAVQPDNHVDIDGVVDLSWQDNLTGYLMNPTLGGLGRKFLTYGPMTGQVMGDNDDAFLAFLWDEREDSPLRLLITTRDEDGNVIATTDYPFDAPKNSGVIAIGPRNLGVIATANTHEVSLQIVSAAGVVVSRFMEYTIDRTCGEAYLRPQAWNPLGGIDSLGMHVRERNGVTVERGVMTKPNMEVTTAPNWVGDFNRRTWAVTMDRTFGVSSKPQTAEMRKWFGENIFTSADVRIPINDSRWTPIIITTKDLDLYTSEKKPAPIRFEFVLGTDNIRQRR